MTQYKTYDRIKSLCQQKGITVSKLERDAGLKPNSIKRWAECKPIANSLFAVARALEVDAESLIREDE